MKIYPTLDSGKAKRLETDLNKRFSKVAERFGAGLQNAGKKVGKGIGSATKLLAGGGVIAMLLNPLDNVLTRVEAIINQADSIGTLAAEYGVDPSALADLQNIFRVYGIQNDEFQNMLNAFSIELGRAKTGESDTLKMYKDLDVLTAFNEALGNIAKTGDAATQDKQLSDIFGARRSGRMVELLQASPEQRQASYQKIKVQDPALFNQLIGQTGALEEAKAIGDIQNENAALIRDMQTINNETINDILRLQAERDKTMTENIKNISELASIAQVAESVQQALTSLIGPILKEIKPVLPQLIEGIKAGANFAATGLVGLINLCQNAIKWFGGGRKK